ncbi:MAG: hypothetical protein AAGH40_14065 [Verrucomicrobiota bacterium]
MGLTIHFSGEINEVAEIPKFVDELADIAESMDWSSQTINMDEADPNFRGILVNPKGDCEPLRFLFDREGHLRNFMDLLDDRVEPNEHSFYSASKTQFAGIETHVWIIGLLRYLKKCYLGNLEVSDEGGYWETENMEKLREKKEFLSGMTDKLAGELSQSKRLPEGASVDDIAAHIERLAKRLNEEKSNSD